MKQLSIAIIWLAGFVTHCQKNPPSTPVQNPRDSALLLDVSPSPRPTPVTQQPNTITLDVPAIVPDVQPTVTTSTTNGCTATPRQAFHLRSSPRVESVGTQLPAGTVLTILGVATEGNSTHPIRRRDQSLMRVRTLANTPDASDGFAFVGPTELSDQCPVVWAETSSLNTNSSNTPSAITNANRGAALNQAFQQAVANIGSLTRTNTTVNQRLDLDGDGTIDEIVRISTESEHFSDFDFAVFQHNNTFIVYDVGAITSAEHPSFARGSSPEAPLRYTGVNYLLNRASETSGEPNPPINDSQDYWLQRCRLHGPCPIVFSASALFGSSETWSFSDAGNGNVRITSGRRSQVLQWDAPNWRLVPR